jgi:hypothetical protein
MAEPDTTAAELALGVLDGADRAAALRRVIGEPGFAREVERWRDRFALLFAGVPEEVAPAGVFEKVEARIDGRDGARRAVNPWKPTAIAASLAEDLPARNVERDIVERRVTSTKSLKVLWCFHLKSRRQGREHRSADSPVSFSSCQHKADREWR